MISKASWFRIAAFVASIAAASQPARAEWPHRHDGAPVRPFLERLLRMHPAAASDRERAAAQTPSGPGHAYLWERGSMRDLGTLGGPSSAAFALNDHGQVAGLSIDAHGSIRPFLWERGVMTDLGKGLADGASVHAISNSGSIVGGTTVDGAIHAFVWRRGSVTDLHPWNDTPHSEAWDVNDHDQVVGFSITEDSQFHAVLWENGVARDLGTLGGTFSSAWRINNRGQIAGLSETHDGHVRACLWDGGRAIDLGTLGGDWSEALGINDVGQVLGWSGTDTGDTHAFLWEAGVMTDLGLSLRDFGLPHALNNRGQVVLGDPYFISFPVDACSSISSAAFLWSRGQTRDLGSLGGEGTTAHAVNNRGQVVGMSRLPWQGPPPPSPSHIWSKGLPLGFAGRDVAVDGSGNVFLGGGTTGQAVDLGGGPVAGPFLAKFDSNGAHQWSAWIPTPGDAEVAAIATDDAGSSVLAIRLFTPAPPAVRIQKALPIGGFVWDRTLLSTAGVSVGDLAVDLSGSALVFGEFRGNMTIGGSTFSSGTGSAMFVTKLDAQGTHQWSRVFPFTGNVRTNVITVDGDGQIVVVGSLDGTCDFGGGVLASTDYDLFLAKLDADGNHQWSKSFGGPGSQFVTDAASDPDGSIFVALGRGLVQLEPGGPSARMHLIKFDSSGRVLWTRDRECGTLPAASGIAADRFGNVVVTGSFLGVVGLGGPPLTSAGSSDVFVVKYDAGGQLEWDARYGSPEFDRGEKVAVDPNGNVILLGRMDGDGFDAGGGNIGGNGANGFLLGMKDPSSSGARSSRAGPLAAAAGRIARSGEKRLAAVAASPFHASASVRFRLGAAGPVLVQIFDVRGRLVSTLADGARSAGMHTVEWKAANAPTGIYFCRLIAGDAEETIRLIRMR